MRRKPILNEIAALVIVHAVGERCGIDMNDRDESVDDLVVLVNTAVAVRMHKVRFEARQMRQAMAALMNGGAQARKDDAVDHRAG
jgi:hypothetical protein